LRYSSGGSFRTASRAAVFGLRSLEGDGVVGSKMIRKFNPENYLLLKKFSRILRVHSWAMKE